MNKIVFWLGIAFAGAAAYVLLSDSSGNSQAVDGADEFGVRAGAWGTRKRAGGLGGVLGGKLKQGAGRLVDDPGLEGEGVVDEITGRVKNAVGQAAQTVGGAVLENNG